MLLAGEESELTFIDHSCAEMTVSLVAICQNRDLDYHIPRACKTHILYSFGKNELLMYSFSSLNKKQEYIKNSFLPKSGKCEFCI